MTIELHPSERKEEESESSDKAAVCRKLISGRAHTKKSWAELSSAPLVRPVCRQRIYIHPEDRYRWPDSSKKKKKKKVFALQLLCANSQQPPASDAPGGTRILCPRDDDHQRRLEQSINSNLQTDRRFLSQHQEGWKETSRVHRSKSLSSSDEPGQEEKKKEDERGREKKRRGSILDPFVISQRVAKPLPIDTHSCNHISLSFLSLSLNIKTH